MNLSEHSRYRTQQDKLTNCKFCACRNCTKVAVFIGCHDKRKSLPKCSEHCDGINMLELKCPGEYYIRRCGCCGIRLSDFDFGVSLFGQPPVCGRCANSFF